MVLLCFLQAALLLYGFDGEVGGGRAGFGLGLLLLLFLRLRRALVVDWLVEKLLAFLHELLVDSYNGVKGVSMRSRLTALVVVFLG